MHPNPVPEFVSTRHRYKAIWSPYFGEVGSEYLDFQSYAECYAYLG